jgi:HPt (histidine-containing phosphotransfer) domain-containing protein
MSTTNPAVVEDTTPAAPPPEMHEALALVQRIGGAELLHKVIGLFRTTSEQRMGALRVAVAAGERQQVSRLAHAMKGSAAQVGAESLRALSAALEKEAAALDLIELQQRLEPLGAAVVVSWSQLESCGRMSGGES